MHIKILNLHTCMPNIQYMYDDLLLPQSPMLQPHYNDLHHIENALKAASVYKNDQEYIIRDNQVMIIDEHTGRVLPGRRFSNGLHQALEAKEGVEIQRESKTLASITFQNFFRLYGKLS